MVPKNTQEKAQDKQSDRLYIKIDAIFLILSVTSFATRYVSIENPRAVVFDELHYIKFISLYARRIFFFDPQPPLGKQLITLIAYLANFEGDLNYSHIGDHYKSDVPVSILRLLPCICGSLLAPLCYSISLELGFSQSTAILVSSLIIFENSLLTQSRFLLLDSILLFFSILSILCYLKFVKSHSVTWLSLASISATLAICTKYSGFYSYCLLSGLVIHSWWQLLDQGDRIKIFKKTLYFAACLFILPLATYISIYYAHLAWLTKAGPHDSIMTSAFQASLENGLASITKGQPLEIVHGSQITLRHTHGRSCWLHSHEHLYPVKYSDGRGSSHQQQVTCYSFKDVNNWWIVKRPHVDELVVTEPPDRIRDGDLIQLVHGLTGRTLNSHDVASAMSPYSQEVSCYVDHNISMPAQDVWRVRLTNSETSGGFWHTINSLVQLIHLNSSLALRFSGRQLPDWGFHQHEIVTDKELKNDDTIWNVEEHRHTKTEDQKEREIQLGQAEFVPLEPTSLNFFEKFYEIHYKLLSYQQDAVKDHLYACESPIDWILSLRGTAYWADTSINSSAQVFLICNVTTGTSGIICIALISLAFIYYLLRRRRQIYDDITPDIWSKFQLQVIVLVGGYLTHLVPYFLYESPLFLQFYLNALIFKILCIGACVQHICDLQIKHYIPQGLMALILAGSLNTFLKLMPLSYGTHLTRNGLENLKWKETWHLITTNV